MQKVIILRGTPASGKSTIAKSYRSFEKKIVWLKVDNFKEFFDDESKEALAYVNRTAISPLEYLLDEGFSVVIDGVFQETKAIDAARDIAKKKNVPCKVFELQAPLEILQKRDQIREGVLEGKRPLLGPQTIQQIYNKLKDNPCSEAISLNVYEYNLENCKQIIDHSFD